MMRCKTNLVLIGGSSHTGKSSLAKSLAEQPGWSMRSTDYLARHPGRPWSRPDWDVPPHVVEYYRSSDMDFLLADVLHHYRGKIWPKVMDIVMPLLGGSSADRVPRDPAGFVLEGSALLPELVVTLPQDCVRALWLTCSEACFRERMYGESDYACRTTAERALIDTFLARTIAFDAWIMNEVQRLDLPWLDVSTMTADELVSFKVV